MYKKGELEAMVALLPGVELVEGYYDTGNWAVVVRKIGPAPDEPLVIPDNLVF